MTPSPIVRFGGTNFNSCARTGLEIVWEPIQFPSPFLQPVKWLASLDQLGRSTGRPQGIPRLTHTHTCTCGWGTGFSRACVPWVWVSYPYRVYPVGQVGACMGTARQGRAEVWAGRLWAHGQWSGQVEQVGRQGHAHLGKGGPRSWARGRWVGEGARTWAREG